MVESTPKTPTGVAGDPRRELPRTGANSAAVRNGSTRIEQLQARARQLTSPACGACRGSPDARGACLLARIPSIARFPYRSDPFVARGRADIRRLAARLQQPLHSRGLCRLPDEGSSVWPESLLRSPER